MSSLLSKRPRGRYWLEAVVLHPNSPEQGVERFIDESIYSDDDHGGDTIVVQPLFPEYCRSTGSIDELAITPSPTRSAPKTPEPDNHRCQADIRLGDYDEGYASLELSPKQKSSWPESTYSATDPAPKIYWTFEQRQAVCVLQRWYITDWVTFGTIFKIHFATELADIHKSPHLLGRALSAQWYDIKAGVKDDAYRLVFEETLFIDEKGKWRNLRDTFEEIAAREGLILELKCENKYEVLNRSFRRKAKRKLNTRSYVAQSISSKEIGSEVKRQKVGKRSWQDKHTKNKIQRLDPVHELPVSSQSLYHDPPRIGFRSYNSENYGINDAATGFRAGKYTCATDVIPESPDINSDIFDAEADKHLSREMTGPTSLISFRDNLLPAFHDAMHKTNASIAVIDLGMANATTKVYSAAWAIDSLNRKTRRAWHRKNQYRGHGEWLVWGAVPQEAIIATFTIEQLYAAFNLAGCTWIASCLRFDIFQEHKQLRKVRNTLRNKPCHISSESGYALDMAVKFMDIPDEFVGHLIQVFVKGWKFLGDQSPSVRAKFVNSVVVEGFLKFEEEEEKSSPLFGCRTERLLRETEEMVRYPAEPGNTVFRKAKHKVGKTFHQQISLDPQNSHL